MEMSFYLIRIVYLHFSWLLSRTKLGANHKTETTGPFSDDDSDRTGCGWLRPSTARTTTIDARFMAQWMKAARH